MFPSPKASKDHIVDLTVTKVLNEMGETGRTHGLRTSFRTWVQDTEAASYEVAETALAHVIGNKVERAYARSDLLERRRTLMQQWADYVTQKEEAVAKLPEANVTFVSRRFPGVA